MKFLKHCILGSQSSRFPKSPSIKCANPIRNQPESEFELIRSDLFGFRNNSFYAGSDEGGKVFSSSDRFALDVHCPI